jgi:hypothetical protein
VTSRTPHEPVGHADHARLAHDLVAEALVGAAKLVRATARGEKAVAEARRVAADIEREWEALLGRKRLRELRAGLEELNDALWPPQSTGR